MGEEARVAGKKGKASGRAAKATKGKRYGAGPATTDAHLMARLGEVIQGMKEDFIVVHLQEPCSSCRSYISNATRYPDCPFDSSCIIHNELLVLSTDELSFFNSLSGVRLPFKMTRIMLIAGLLGVKAQSAADAKSLLLPH